MIEETEELQCPICAGVLRHPLFERGAFWECENCENIWNADKLVEEMRDVGTPALLNGTPAYPRPESNFL